MLHSYRKQSIDWHCKSIDRFLYECNIDLIHVLHILHIPFSGTKLLVFSLKALKVVTILQSLGIAPHNLGARKEAVSVPHQTGCTLYLFTKKLYSKLLCLLFVSKMSFLISSAIPIFTLNISVTSFCEFLWWIVRELFFDKSSVNEDV